MNWYWNSKKRGITVTILCLQKKGEKNEYRYKNIKIFKFKPLDFINYRKKLQNSHPDKVLFISSVSSGIMLPLWWLLLAILSRGFNPYFYQTTNFLRINNKFLLKNILSVFYDRFVASDALYNDFAKNLNLKAKIVYPGVNLLKLEKLRSHHKSGINNLCFFGHVSSLKGVDIFLKLVTALPQYHFNLVAGKVSGKNKTDNKLYNQLLKNSPQIKNMQYIGFTEKPLDIMRQCDLLILPYRHGGTILGVAQSAIEAMAMGIPVIGSKNSALESLIKNGVNGFFL